MSIGFAVLLNGRTVQSGDVDNATATASIAAAAGVKHGILGFAADYSSAPAAGPKTVTIKKGTSTVIVLRRDFSALGVMESVPAVIWGDINQAVSVELQASGTGGVTGRVVLFYAPA